uniref:Myosin, light chain 7, regulatory n=1 Tax=Neolamprologus brichardi TaxID=32507 RepID=A0A3Q4N5H4_NEOBR
MASRKASNKRQRGGQKSSSNVFSMFEQSQIQEFKEAFGCIDQDRDGVIKKQDLKETYAQLGNKTWTPQGPKRKTNSTHRKSDSYLQR